MTGSDRVFYQGRAQAELDRAVVASSVCARLIHLELARLYAERLRDKPARRE